MIVTSIVEATNVAEGGSANAQQANDACVLVVGCLSLTLKPAVGKASTGARYERVSAAVIASS